MSDYNYQAKVRYAGSVAKKYNDRRSQTKNWLREDSIVRQIASKIPPKSAVLDAPVGTGRFIDMFVELGLTVHGVDISEDMLTVAADQDSSKQGSVTLQRGDLEAIPLTDKQVDTSFCIRFLNWVPTSVLASSLQELARVSSNQVVVHVRTRRSATLKEIGSSVKPNLSKSLVPSRMIITAKSIVKKVIGRRSTKATTGYEIHNESEFLKILESLGMTIESKHSVDTRVSILARHADAQNIYTLNVDGGKN